MTELAVRVVLKADGSGLVGQLKLSRDELAQFRSDAAGAGAGAAQLGAGAQAAAAGTSALGREAGQAGAAIGEVGRSAGSAQTAVLSLATVEGKLEAILQAVTSTTRASVAANDQLERQLGETATAAKIAETAVVALGTAEAVAETQTGQLAIELNQLSAAAKVAASAQEAAAVATNRSSRTAKENTDAANRQAFAVRNAGQQFGDFGLSVAAGISPARAFGQQAGQLGYALSEMGGTLGKVGGFLVGPWGIALTIAAAVMAPFVEKLFETDKAAELATAGATALTAAQGALGDIFDITTGKLKSQNAQLQASADLLRLNARLSAINLRAEAAQKRTSSGEVLKEAGDRSVISRLEQAALDGLRPTRGGTTALDRRLDTDARNAANLRQMADRVASGKLPIESALKASEDADFEGTNVSRKEFQQALIDSAAARANDERAALIDRSLDDGKLAEGLRRTDNKKPKKPKSTEARDEFGRDAATKIDEIAASFTDTPSQVLKVNKAIADLNDLIDDLARKKPPGFKDLIRDAIAAKEIVRDGISKPFDEYIEAQRQSLEIQKLLTAGKIDEANALKIILGLEEKMGPLTPERKDAVLATVQALRAEQRETEILLAQQQKYLTAIGDVKSAIRGAISGGVDGLTDLPGRIVKAFSDFKANELFDKLFDGAFRELEDQAKGTSIVEDASTRMSSAIDTTIRPLDRLAAAADRAAGGISAGASTAAGSIAAGVAGAATGAIGGADQADPADIIVKGRKPARTANELFTDIAAGLAKGIGISDEAATKIGKFGGKAIEGAATGALTNSFLAPLGKALGFKTSGTGAKIGGAIGGATGIPGGDIIGSIAGSLIGGAFKKTKSGAVTLTSATEEGAVRGNSGAAKKAASGLAGSVQASLNSIAEQLGGQLGDFNVTVGQRHGDYRVTTGTSLKKKKGALDFDDDAEAANSAAVGIAIGQGAIVGLSAAVQKAIQGNDDIETALSEALKVQGVEDLLGGISSAMQKTFKSFETTAQERVRVATKYGLDLVKLEQVNAQQRADVFEEVLSSRLQSIQSLLDDISFGDLSEGSLAEQRTKLLGEIARAQGDAEAGKDGAADTLTSLQRRLLEVSKEGFGTAGSEYASDRSSTVATLERLKTIEADRVKAAQEDARKLGVAAETTAANTGDAAASLAQQGSTLSQILTTLQGSGSAGASTKVNIAATARAATL